MGSQGAAAAAHVGDHLIVRSRQGAPDRDAVIIEIRGENGGPPFLVRWSDDGHEGLLFPGPNAVIDRHDGR